jgi:hypothetical protein
MIGRLNDEDISQREYVVKKILNWHCVKANTVTKRALQDRVVALKALLI